MCQNHLLTAGLYLERLMATAIDKMVASQTHKYDEIDRHSVPYHRNLDSYLDDDAYEPLFHQSHLDPDTKSLGLARAVSAQQADWFSPNSINM